MPQNKLRDYFSNIQSRQQVMDKINADETLKFQFQSWKPEQREQFLDYCTGARGLKLLYDPYFKEIFNPEYTPERLEALLSLLLGQSVHILQVLPNDSTRIADEEALLITDIIVELSDGQIANIEIQKIGYYFPGERTACYTADLLLRQYRRTRSRKKERFSYKDIRTVYTIIFYENSPSEFNSLPEFYIHHGEVLFDTGLVLSLPIQIYMISLDIFRQSFYNRGIRSDLDAWLAFLCLDNPEDISVLLSQHEEFQPLYQHLYDICENVERMMNMFSKELQIMDRNTVRLMVDEMSENAKKDAARINTLNQENMILRQEKNALSEENNALCKERDDAIAEIQKLHAVIDSLKEKD